MPLFKDQKEPITVMN